MKKTIIIMYMMLVFISIKPTYALADLIKNVEFEVGINTGLSNYTMDTAADSWLKWRDLVSVGGLIKATYTIAPNWKLSGGVNYSAVKSGEMTDDDVVNGLGVYSRTITMSGYKLKLDTKLDNIFYRKGKNTFTRSIGFKYQKNAYKPKGLYKLSVKNQLPPVAPYFYVKSADNNSNHTHLNFYGLTLGIGFERASEEQSFAVDLALFVALNVESLQSHWGYEWSAKGSEAGSASGLDLNLSQGLKISKTLWINIFGGIEYLHGTNSILEYGVGGDPTKPPFKIDYLDHYTISAGLSLKF